MQTTKPNHQREYSGNTCSGDRWRRPAKQIVRFFNKTNAVLMLAAVAYALPAKSQAQTVVSFDPPGSIGTQVGAISALGEITGNYTDTNGNNHGFLRTPEGQFTTFDEPGDTTNQFGNSVGVNSAGEITGNFNLFIGDYSFFGPPQPFYVGASFLRLPDGTIFDITPADAYESQVFGINEQGTVAGTLGLASDGSQHFFVRAANGTYTLFDAEAGDRPQQIAINQQGATTGWYFDTGFNAHAFLRTAQGTLTTFDYPGALETFFQGTTAVSINPSGAITGVYSDTNYVNHGFLRSNNGQFTTFDPEDSVNTSPVGIAPNGVIVGNYSDTNYVQHGFLRAKNGQITSFDPADSISTTVAGINPSGEITGYYSDTNYVNHGFVFQIDEN